MPQTIDEARQRPTDAAVRRLADKPGWCHTIEVAPGVRTRSAYDHTPHLLHCRHGRA
jgi:hypothetical protein